MKKKKTIRANNWKPKKKDYIEVNVNKNTVENEIYKIK